MGVYHKSIVSARLTLEIATVGDFVHNSPLQYSSGSRRQIRHQLDIIHSYHYFLVKITFGTLAYLLQSSSILNFNSSNGSDFQDRDISQP